MCVSLNFFMHCSSLLVPTSFRTCAICKVFCTLHLSVEQPYPCFEHSQGVSMHLEGLALLELAQYHSLYIV